MINRVVLVGRLTRDIQLKMTSSGKKTASFTLAVNRRGKDAGADFPQCVAWENVADLLAQYTHKGSLIGVEGRLQTGSYDDAQTGKRIYTTNIAVETITFLDTRQAEAPQADNMVSDEELPF